MYSCLECITIVARSVYNTNYENRMIRRRNHQNEAGSCCLIYKASKGKSIKEFLIVYSTAMVAHIYHSILTISISLEGDCKLQDCRVFNNKIINHVILSSKATLTQIY